MTVNEGQGAILLLGAGRMGSALLGGWIESGIAPAAIAVVEPAPGAELLASSQRHGFALNKPVSALPHRAARSKLLPAGPGNCQVRRPHDPQSTT